MILKPDYNVDSLFDLNFEELKNIGIKAILFDLDSTLMPSKSGIFPENIKLLLNELKKNFTIAIISNNKNESYIEKVKAQADFTVIGNANKPNCKIMKEYLSSINILPAQTIVIGDRPLTDILSGMLLGAKTALTDSITKETENKLTRLVRKIERLVIRK